MVLDNLIRGLADEEIKAKVFALPEEDCTAEQILRFLDAKELGRSSVLDIRPAGEAQQISGYMRNRMAGSQLPKSPTEPRGCWRCKGTLPHKGSKCPDWHKFHCDHCKKKGHTTERC